MPTTVKVQGTSPRDPKRDPKEAERYTARAQSLLRQEEKMRKKASAGRALAWIGLVFATTTLAIPTGSFLSSVLNTLALICYLLAFVLHLALASSVDYALKSRWKPSASGMKMFAVAIAFLVVILAGIGYRRYDTYLEGGDAPVSAASSALLWFFLESVIPVICGIVLALVSDEAQRRTENCHYFEGLIEHLETNPGRERESWDAQVADADRKHKEAKRHYPDARRLIAQLGYVLNQLEVYHPDRDVTGDDDDIDGTGVSGGDPLGMPPSPSSHMLNIYTNRAKHTPVYTER